MSKFKPWHALRFRHKILQVLESSDCIVSIGHRNKFKLKDLAVSNRYEGCFAIMLLEYIPVFKTKQDMIIAELNDEPQIPFSTYQHTRWIQMGDLGMYRMVKLKTESPFQVTISIEQEKFRNIVREKRRK